MFLHLKYIKFKNLMSYGNEMTEFHFDKGLHLIMAPVGSGKSSIIEVLTYNFYGKPYRDIKLASLINRTNKKDLYTESCFNIGKDQYKIIRTMKPDSLKIYKNDNLLSLLSSKKLDQEEIDKILGVDYKMFKQIVSLAVCANKPYFTMSAQEKRDTIESVFNIKIFGQMEQITKKKITALKTEISINESTLNVMENNITLQRKQLKDLKQMKEKFYKDKEKNINDYQNEIADYQNEIVSIKNDIEEINPKISELVEKTSSYQELKLKQSQLYSQQNEITSKKVEFKSLSKSLEESNLNVINENGNLLVEKEEKIKLEEDFKILEYKDVNEYRKENEEIITKISTLNANISQLNKELSFLSNDKCPTCKRELDQQYKDENEIRIKNEITDINEKLKTLSIRREELNQLIKTQTEVNKKIDDLKNKIKNKDESIKRILQSIDKLMKLQKENEKKLEEIQIEKILEDDDKIKKELDDISKKFNEIETYNKEKSQLDIQLNTLKTRLSYLEKTMKDVEKKLNEQKEKEFEMNIDEIENNFKIECEKYSNLYSKNDEINKKLTNYKIVAELLSKEGIKSFYLKKLIPILNMSVNSYLQKFELPVRLEFNEKMEDVIYGLGGFEEQLEYASHSGGERTKLDLSVAFGFIDTCKCISNWNSSLLCIDEILDANTDTETLERVIESLKNMIDQTKESSVYIISHKAADLKNSFNSVIEIEKQDGFSRIKGC